MKKAIIDVNIAPEIAQRIFTNFKNLLKFTNFKTETREFSNCVHG